MKNDAVEQGAKLIAGKRCPVAFDHHSEAYAQLGANPRNLFARKAG
jgi:hypothetical protein